MALLDQLKVKSAITWESDYTDARLEASLASAVAFLTRYLGVDEDYDWTETGIENELLLSMAWYLYNGVTVGEFKDSYLPELTEARAMHADPPIMEADEDLEDDDD